MVSTILQEAHGVVWRGYGAAMSAGAGEKPAMRGKADANGEAMNDTDEVERVYRITHRGGWATWWALFLLRYRRKDPATVATSRFGERVVACWR
jgi:hypothetical protein